MSQPTADSTRNDSRDARAVRPGLIAVFSGASLQFIPLAIGDAALPIGRASGVGSMLPDDRLSRQHATIARTAEGFVVTDLGSRNGTFVDGEQVRGEVRARAPRVIRVGESLFVPCDDTARAHAPDLTSDVIGGTKLQQSLEGVARAAAFSETLLVLGESGTGKELAAARFHALGPNARGPLVAVNCAAVPEGLAERLLFGAKRGTYSGATSDSTGHLQAADRGVLFLDEAGELDLQVQAKLLRVLETREVVPLGASIGARVSLRIVFATHRDLRGAVADGKFRADLYHRISPPEVSLPPLRERLDEIAAHVVDETSRAAPGLAPTAKLVEACLLRAWPGNVRELRKQVRHAAIHARSEGLDRVRIEHLPEAAGRAVARPTPATEVPAASATPTERRTYTKWSLTIAREDIVRALAESHGNVSLAARNLGMARSQFYREMGRFDVKPTSHDA